MSERVVLLPDTPSDTGDLFGRGMRDLAYALGYEQVVLNVAKAGREVDMQAQHRVEKRSFIGECKAHKTPRGGADINKFAGVVEAERITRQKRDDKVNVEGYFVSLTGFTATALEQEEQLGDRIHLIGPGRIISLLAAGRIIVPLEEAALSAAELAGGRKLVGTALGLHDRGWLWVLVLQSNDVSHEHLILHADGTAATLTFVESIQGLHESFPGFRPLNAPAPQAGVDVSEADALARYVDHLNSEHGSITLEGLPTDEDVSTRRLRLESLFVPMHLVPITAAKDDSEDAAPADDGSGLAVTDGALDAIGEAVDTVDHSAEVDEGDAEVAEVAKTDDSGGADEDEDEDEDVFDVDVLEEDFDFEAVAADFAQITTGAMLASSRHSALLAMPGGGKSTLIKRLAVAYSQGGRLAEASDELPVQDWLPVVIRCRQLGDLVREPIQTILDEVPVRAELADAAEAFRRIVQRKLVSGEILLLIDGLDEISDAGQRIAFVSQLRTFMSRYPAVQLVVTSRESGFRAVAGAVADLCVRYRIAELSDEDITNLTVAWHREVIGNKADVLSEAADLAGRILATDRVRQLAKNPLLLTTLLLVKRWVGDLPRKRSVLYSKAIEVLLATWNVEGHEPLDQDEVLPQLGFVAHRMMEAGRQTIPAGLLTEWLTDARAAMPDILGYARTSVTSLVDRVEERSSLLSLSGHEEYAGRLQPTYEFKHLTFQEYLTALALASGWFDGANAGATSADALGGHFQEPTWKEVVPLTAVLAGRHSGRLVEALIPLAQAEVDAEPESRGDRHAYDNLVACLVDEVPVSPDLLRDALAVVARGGGSTSRDPFVRLLETRFKAEIAPTLKAEFGARRASAFATGSHILQVALAERGVQPLPRVLEWLASESPDDRRVALLYLMEALYVEATGGLVMKRRGAQLSISHDDQENAAARMLRATLTYVPASDEEGFIRAWAMAWGLISYNLPSERKSQVVNSLLSLWFSTASEASLVASSWGLWTIAPEHGLALRPLSDHEKTQVRARQSYDGPREDDVRRAALAVDVLYGLTPQPEILGLLEATAGPRSDAMRRLLDFVRGEAGDVAISPRRRKDNEHLPMLPLQEQAATGPTSTDSPSA